MKAILPTLLAAAVLVPAAAAGQMQPVNPPDPRIADGSAQRRLDAAQATWRAAGIRSYRYVITRSCFCAPRSKGARVVVRGGTPAKQSARLTELATVPRMFRAIRKAISGRYHGLDVTYGRYGVPSSISLDPVANIADEETSYRVSRFRHP